MFVLNHKTVHLVVGILQVKLILGIERNYLSRGNCVGMVGFMPGLMVN